MTGVEFIQNVKAKLNRLDSAAYQDVRRELVIYLGNEALKTLILEFDTGQYSRNVTPETLAVYLAGLTLSSAEEVLTANALTLPSLLKVKDVEVYVEVDNESGWMPTRDKNNIKTSDLRDSPFLKSFPDQPIYRLINGKIEFEAPDFSCTKVRYDYLKVPDVFTEGSTLTYGFMSELENKTVTLLLENLESSRLQSQPVVSKS